MAKAERIKQLSVELNKALNDLSKAKFDVERCKGLSDKAENMLNRHIRNHEKNGIGYVEIAPPMNGTNSFMPLTEEEIQKEKTLVKGVFKSAESSDTPTPSPTKIPASSPKKHEVKIYGVFDAFGSSANETKPKKEDKGKGVSISEEKPGDLKVKDLVSQQKPVVVKISKPEVKAAKPQSRAGPVKGYTWASSTPASP